MLFSGGGVRAVSAKFLTFSGLSYTLYKGYFKSQVKAQRMSATKLALTVLVFSFSLL